LWPASASVEFECCPGTDVLQQRGGPRPSPTNSSVRIKHISHLGGERRADQNVAWSIQKIWWLIDSGNWDLLWRRLRSQCLELTSSKTNEGE
jgi:hypothetical protein